MEKIEKLFDLAAERGPESIRIFALRRIDEPKKSGDVLNEDAEALKRYFAPLEASKTVEGRPHEKRIRVDLEKQNTGIRVYKEQEWKSGPKYRLDQAFGFLDLDDLGTEKEFDRTVVNVGDSRNGDYSNWSIIYGPKAAGFDHRRGSTYEKVGLWNVFYLDREASLSILTMLGDARSLQAASSDRRLKPELDSEKAERLLRKAHPSLEVVVGGVFYEGREAEQFDLVALPMRVKAVSIVVDRSDYRRIFAVRVFGPDGRLAIESLRSEFDEETGRPGRWVRREALPNGQTRVTTVIIKEVELNPDTSNAFAFAPPDDFSITDYSYTPPRITRQASFNGVRVADQKPIVLGDNQPGHSFTRAKAFYLLLAMLAASFAYVYVRIARRGERPSSETHSDSQPQYWEGAISRSLKSSWKTAEFAS